MVTTMLFFFHSTRKQNSFSSPMFKTNKVDFTSRDKRVKRKEKFLHELSSFIERRDNYVNFVALHSHP